MGKVSTKSSEIEQMSRDRFDKILLQFLFKEPFFSDIMRHIRKEMTTCIPTAGVMCVDDTIVMYWNPEYIAGLPVKKVFGLLKHECYHLIYQHCTSRMQKPHLMWNIATDLAINCTLCKTELPDGGLVPGQPIQQSGEVSHLPKTMHKQVRKLSSFIESLPPSKSSEWYMESIMNDNEVQQAIRDCMGPKSIMMDGGDDGGSGQAGTCAGFDYHFDNDDMSEGEKAMIDAKVQSIIEKAATRAERNNSWGSISADVRAQIHSMLSKSINWKSVLLYFCGTKQRANHSRSFRKINRKYPYIHPGRKTRHTSNIAIYIDQSGSVGDDDLALFFGVLNNLASRTTFTIFHFDTSVDENSKYVWRKNQKIEKPYRTRGGGTNFDCVEDHFRKVSREYDGYIIMTDGYAPKPKPSISKRCWVLLPGIRPSFSIDRRDATVLMNREES